MQRRKYLDERQERLRIRTLGGRHVDQLAFREPSLAERGQILGKRPQSLRALSLHPDGADSVRREALIDKRQPVTEHGRQMSGVNLVLPAHAHQVRAREVGLEDRGQIIDDRLKRLIRMVAAEDLAAMGEL